MPTRFAPKTGLEGKPARDIGEELLAYLRGALGEPSLSFVEPPSPISGGFETTIFGFTLKGVAEPFAEPLVVRIYGPFAPDDQCRFEQAVQNSAAAAGFPAPPVLLGCEDATVLGGPFVVMPRVPGSTMIDRMFGPRVFSTFTNLARLQAQLHALDPEPVREALLGIGTAPERLNCDFDLQWIRETIVDARLTGLEPAFAWLLEHRPQPEERPALCHGDFHPINILMQGNEVTGVIDWGWAKITDPMWDVGATVALMTEAPVNVPAFLSPVIRRVRRWLVGRYLKAYAATRPLDRDRLRYFESLRLTGFLAEAGRDLQAKLGVVPLVDKPSAFTAAHVQRGIIQRLGEITGVASLLPVAAPK